MFEPQFMCFLCKWCSSSAPGEAGPVLLSSPANEGNARFRALRRFVAAIGVGAATGRRRQSTAPGVDREGDAVVERILTAALPVHRPNGGHLPGAKVERLQHQIRVVVVAVEVDVRSARAAGSGVGAGSAVVLPLVVAPASALVGPRPHAQDLAGARRDLGPRERLVQRLEGCRDRCLQDARGYALPARPTPPCGPCFPPPKAPRTRPRAPVFCSTLVAKRSSCARVAPCAGYAPHLPRGLLRLGALRL